MTTLQDLVSEAKRHLQSYEREPRNRLANPVAADAETLVLDFDIQQIQAGAHLQVGLELMYVWMTEPSSKTITVARGQLGSVATSHLAGASVTVNPKFPDFAIVKAINDDLHDLSSPVNGLFAERSVDLVGTSHSFGYDIDGASDLLGLLDVRAQHSGQPRTWTPVTNYELTRQTSSSDFPSGYGLHLAEGVMPGRTLRVVYKASFAPLVNLTDDVEAVSGLPVTAHDLPPMGAAVRLVAPREIARNFHDSQGDSRRAQEVPPGAVAGSMRAVATWRAQRINDEALRLQQRWPHRQFIPVGAPEMWS